MLTIFLIFHTISCFDILKCLSGWEETAPPWASQFLETAKYPGWRLSLTRKLTSLELCFLHQPIHPRRQYSSAWIIPMCWFKHSSGASLVYCEIGPPQAKGKERQKKEAGYSRLAGGGYKKQGRFNLLMRLMLGGLRWVPLLTHTAKSSKFI